MSSTPALPALLLLGVCACHTESHLGTLPPRLVELYDQGSPTGVLELEADRSGRVFEMEVDVDPAVLPAGVRNAALAEYPGAVILGAEREIQLDHTGWEVKFKHGGRNMELVLSDAGTILETEKELGPGEAPPAVFAAAQAQLKDATVTSIEVVERFGGEIEYHVKKSRSGASYKLVLSPDGQPKRIVREARAEIEIPLKSP